MDVKVAGRVGVHRVGAGRTAGGAQVVFVGLQGEEEEPVTAPPLRSGAPLPAQDGQRLPDGAGCSQLLEEVSPAGEAEGGCEKSGSTPAAVASLRASMIASHWRAPIFSAMTPHCSRVSTRPGASG